LGIGPHFSLCIFSISDDKRLIEDHKQEVDTLQRKVSELQAEYQAELKKAKHTNEVCYITCNTDT